MNRAVSHVLVAALALCAGLPGRALAAKYHLESSLGLRMLVGAGDLGGVASPSVGGSLDFDLVNESGGLGVRAALGGQAFAGDEVTTSASLGLFGYTWDFSDTYTTTQGITLATIGPNWTIPHRNGRTELYLMVGTAESDASGMGVLYNTHGDEPGSRSTWAAIAGAEYVVPLETRMKKTPLLFEAGGELLMGGTGTFWGSPPIVSDGSGGYVYRTRDASLAGFMLRVGLGFRGRRRQS
jgi:hypothetical protein